jgi:hypothetical protein
VITTIELENSYTCSHENQIEAIEKILKKTIFVKFN